MYSRWVQFCGEDQLPQCFSIFIFTAGPRVRSCSGLPQDYDPGSWESLEGMISSLVYPARRLRTCSEIGQVRESDDL